MKAWKIDAHGGSEALKQVTLSDPVPGPMEARIRVQAVGLNHLDVWVRKGVPGHKFPLPLIPGCDAVGVIESFGPGTEAALGSAGLQIGSSVIVSPGVSCGRCEACLSGNDPICPQYGIFGETQNGGCAEYLVVPAVNLIPRPPSLSVEQAAALPIPFLTAWTMLERKARLQPGETVLIHAGGSGVGVAAIQIAKLLGAHVITTVGSSEKASAASALGADHVIEYRKEPFRDGLKRIAAEIASRTGAPVKRGVAVVLDHIGADTFADSLKSLALGGRLVTCGATSGGEVHIDLKTIFFKNLSILGTTMGSKGDLVRIVELAAQGRLHPIVARTFDFSELPVALELLESRSVFGKVVLRVP